MTEQNFKTCRYCGEQIKVAAKICPRCRQWLSLLSWRNPVLLFGSVCLWCLSLFVVLTVSFHRMLDPGTDFSPYRNQITVADSRMIFGTNMYNKPFAAVVAVVTNQSDMPWKEVEFQARFFDKTGALIDVGRGEYYPTLYPGTDGAIWINTGMLRPFADYASYRIYIGSAEDSHTRL